LILLFSSLCSRLLTSSHRRYAIRVLYGLAEYSCQTPCQFLLACHPGMSRLISSNFLGGPRWSVVKEPLHTASCCCCSGRFCGFPCLRAATPPHWTLLPMACPPCCGSALLALTPAIPLERDTLCPSRRPSHPKGILSWFLPRPACRNCCGPVLWVLRPSHPTPFASPLLRELGSPANWQPHPPLWTLLLMACPTRCGSALWCPSPCCPTILD
jgi:hypothetical protein